MSAENDICKRNAIKSINRPSLLKQYGLIQQTDSILLSFENGDRAWVKSIYEAKDVNFHLGEKRSKPNAVTEYLDYNYKQCYQRLNLFLHTLKLRIYYRR